MSFGVGSVKYIGFLGMKGRGRRAGLLVGDIIRVSEMGFRRGVYVRSHSQRS